MLIPYPAIFYPLDKSLDIPSIRNILWRLLMQVI